MHLVTLPQTFHAPSSFVCFTVQLCLIMNTLAMDMHSRSSDKRMTLMTKSVLVLVTTQTFSISCILLCITDFKGGYHSHSGVEKFLPLLN